MVSRRNARGGRSAAEHLIAAIRCLYRHADNDGYITRADNPALKVAKPGHLPSTRAAIPDSRLADINRIAASTGNDPALDALILRLHTETACRRGGALSLTFADIDAEQCLLLLKEKGETVRWQPISPTLTKHLVHHVRTHGGTKEGPLLRYASGKPITARRYDYLLEPHRQALGLGSNPTNQHPLATAHHPHMGRTDLRLCHRPRVRGHTNSNAAAGATVTYVRATLAEIATALQTLTGEPHPLAGANH